jgi:hypothetical protein
LIGTFPRDFHKRSPHKDLIKRTQVALIPDTLNSGDVFILDAGRHIFQWNGKGASRVEKTKALEVSMCVCVCVCLFFTARTRR